MRTVMLALFVWCFQMTMAQAGVYDLSSKADGRTMSNPTTAAMRDLFDI